MASRAHYSRAKIARIRLLSAELETQRNLAIERTRSIESKAGFLVLAGGLLAAQAVPVFANTQISALAVVLAVTRLVLAFSVTLFATMVLWPLRIPELGPDGFIKKWIDSCEPKGALEDYILEVKARTIAKRNAKNETRAKLLKAGFVLLVIGILVAVAAGFVAS